VVGVGWLATPPPDARDRPREDARMDKVTVA